MNRSEPNLQNKEAEIIITSVFLSESIQRMDLITIIQDGWLKCVYMFVFDNVTEAVSAFITQKASGESCSAWLCVPQRGNWLKANNNDERRRKENRKNTCEQKRQREVEYVTGRVERELTLLVSLEARPLLWEADVTWGDKPTAGQQQQHLVMTHRKCRRWIMYAGGRMKSRKRMGLSL